MKAYLKLLIVPLLIATACSPAYVGTSAFQDDIYYIPGEKTLIEKEMAVYADQSDRKTADIQKTSETIPLTKNTFKDDREFQLIQKQYKEMLANDSIGYVDTTFYNEDQGYFLSSFDGDDRDRREAERLREMYPQGFGYSDGSGYSIAMWLAGSHDWNIYIDGDRVWWTPTQTNFSGHQSFIWSPLRYGHTFAYNYSSYYGSSFGFGIGNGFYDDFYWNHHLGWNSPFYGHNYFSHNGHYYPHYNNVYHPSRPSNRHYARRTNMGGRTNSNHVYTSRSANSRTQGSVKQARRSSNSQLGISSRRRSTAGQRYNSQNSRNTYGNRTNVTSRRTSGTVGRSNGGTTRYGSQNRSSYNRTKTGTTTRRRTSSYRTPRGNSRPSYNNSGTRRSSHSRSSSSRVSGYSKVKNTSGYSRQSSSRRSSSSYSRPTRSSSSRSSGSVRSSGSSSRSSSSGTRSGSSSNSSGGSRRR